MQIETTHGSVTFSRSSGEQLLRVFSARWAMPVVSLTPGGDNDAAYGVVFQVGAEEAWCFLHLLPADRGGDVEVLLALLEKAMSEALCRLAEWRPPGALLPCACLLERDDGSMAPGMAVFTSDALTADGGPGARSELADAFVDVLSTTQNGAMLPPFEPPRRVPRLEAGAIKFDTALVDGSPLCFRVQPTDPAEQEEQRELATIWARGRVKHIAWAPAVPIFLSREEAEAIGVSAPARAPAQSDARAAPDRAVKERAAAAMDAFFGEDPEPPAPPRPSSLSMPAFSEATTEPDPAAAATRSQASIATPAMAPGEPKPEGGRRRRRGGTSSSIWGPTVMDFQSELRDTGDRETLIRLRGATIGSDDDEANQAALEAVARADAAAREGAEDVAPDAGLQLPSIAQTKAQSRSTELGASAELPSFDAATADETGDDEAAAAPQDRFKATAVGGRTDPAASGVSAGAVIARPDATSWDAPTVDALARTGDRDTGFRQTSGYVDAPARPTSVAEAPSTPADPKNELSPPQGLRALGATSWGALHDFAGDRAHAAMIATALRASLRTPRWPSSLPTCDRVDREGADLALIDNGEVVALLSARIGRDLDPIAMAVARSKHGDVPAWAITLEALEAAQAPVGWRIRTIDELQAWCDGVGDSVLAAHAEQLAELRRIRDAFAHDALADATHWHDALADSPLGPSLRQVLHREVLSRVIQGLRGHGWPQLNHDQICRGQAPTVRVFDAGATLHGGVPTTEVAIVDPTSPHVFGVRAMAGRVLIYAEAFDVRRTGLGATLAWGRRNEFLRDLCGLLQIDTKFIEGHATDRSRWVEIDNFELLRADQRSNLAQTLVETAWVLWQRTHEGRLQRR